MKILGYISFIPRKVIVFTVLAGIVSGLGSAALMGLIGGALSNRGFNGTTALLKFLGVSLIVLVSGIISQILLVRLSQGLSFDLRMTLCRRILSASLRKLEEIGSHRVMASLTGDVFTITDALINLPTFIISFITMIVCLLYLGWLSGTGLLVVIGFIALGVSIYYLIAQRAERLMKIARHEQDELFKHFEGLTEGIKELKLHRARREVFVSDLLYGTALSQRRHYTNGMMIYTVAGMWSQLLMSVLVGTLLFVLPLMNIVESRTLASYTLIIFFLMGPITFMVGQLPNVSRANIALEHLEDLSLSLSKSSVEADTPAQTDQSSVFQTLELEGVTHAYLRERDDSNFVLGPIDLTFQRGELIFLIGGNGSGKTTLAKLLVGLYLPANGKIRLNGHLITDQTRESYRQQFSTVFTDFFLFERLLGLEATDLDAQAHRYLVHLELDHKVQVKEGVFSTTALSQGQRKRLALLVAYLEDRPFYVFDEWASGQDPQYKDVFYKQLLPELKSRGKTVLVISHDEKYFDLADRLIKLDYGKLEYDERIYDRVLISAS